MKDLKNFFNEFLNRSGLQILNATILARILSFFASWIALQFIPNIELGLVIYAMNIITLIIPITGLGAYQGLLRYGSLLDTEKEKSQLFSYILKKGSLFSILLILITVLFSTLFSENLAQSKPYLMALSLSILTLFLLESMKVQFRVLHLNKLFAKTEIIYNILFLVLVTVGSYTFQEKGYIAAIIITPLITFFIFISKIKIVSSLPNKFKKPDLNFWKYSFFTGLSNVANQLIIVLDIILIGLILKDPGMITFYKYLAIIPFSMLFLPRAMLTTDFVTLTQNHLNHDFIQKYIKNYLYIFVIISILATGISFLFTDLILSFFGKEFIQYRSVFRILMVGISAVLILRGLFGNLLSALGKAFANYWISFTGIMINIVSNYILIPKYGIMGAAITSAVIMWITSLLSVILYYYFSHKIKKTYVD